jgi:hypothetical protein
VSFYVLDVTMPVEVFPAKPTESRLTSSNCGRRAGEVEMRAILDIGLRSAYGL